MHKYITSIRSSCIYVIHDSEICKCMPAKTCYISTSIYMDKPNATIRTSMTPYITNAISITHIGVSCCMGCCGDMITLFKIPRYVKLLWHKVQYTDRHPPICSIQIPQFGFGQASSPYACARYLLSLI